MKMYKKPITEITAFETERMMDGITMSPGAPTGGGGGKTEAPANRGDFL